MNRYNLPGFSGDTGGKESRRNASHDIMDCSEYVLDTLDGMGSVLAS